MPARKPRSSRQGPSGPSLFDSLDSVDPNAPLAARIRARSLDGVARDWPLDYWRLEPFYAVNDRMMGVAGLAGDPAYPPKQLPLPPVPIGPSMSELQST